MSARLAAGALAEMQILRLNPIQEVKKLVIAHANIAKNFLQYSSP